MFELQVEINSPTTLRWSRLPVGTRLLKVLAHNYMIYVGRWNQPVHSTRTRYGHLHVTKLKQATKEDQDQDEKIRLLRSPPPDPHKREKDVKSLPNLGTIDSDMSPNVTPVCRSRSAVVRASTIRTDIGYGHQMERLRRPKIVSILPAREKPQ